MNALLDSEPKAKVLKLLSRDHANFEHLLNCLTHVADLIVAGEEVNLDIVRAGAVYYKGYVAEFHHPIEDLIYGLLRLRIPGAVEHIFPVAEDHRHYADWLGRLLKGLRDFQGHHAKPHGTAKPLHTARGKVVREDLCLTIREFVSHMHAHMHNEVPLFKLAIQHLSQEDWASIARTISLESDPLFDDRRPRFSRLLKAVFTADVTARGKLFLRQARRAA